MPDAGLAGAEGGHFQVRFVIVAPVVVLVSALIGAYRLGLIMDSW